MAATEHEGIIYVKDHVHGTIYLTIDNQDPIAINFFRGIKIQIMLGVIRPECQLKGLLPEAKWCQYIYKPLKLAIGTSVINSTEKSGSLNENMINYSDSQKVVPKDDICNVSEIREVTDLSDDYEENHDFNSVKSVIPHSNTNESVKFGLVHESSEYGKDTSTSEQENLFDSKNATSLSSSKRKSHRSLLHRKQKVTNLKKVVANRNTGTRKKEHNSKIDGKLVKTTSLRGVSLKSRQKNKLIDTVKTKTQSDEPKEKRSAKWKLARQISCQYCLKDFDNQQAFYDHKKTSRSEVYTCYICTKVFPFQAHLQAHISAYHEHEKVFSNLKESASCICDVCGAEVKNLFALKKHLMFHTQEYFYRCCICGKQFVEPGTLNNHMTTHKSGGMIKCKCCDQLFATRGALAKHKLTSVEVKCHLCGQVFPNKTSRTQHYKVFHQNDILKCSKCTSMFSSNEELTVHMTKHNLYKKKQCKTCGKFFSRLEKHIITHKAKAEIDESELFVCDKCPKKFTNRSSFQRHLTIHSQDRPYQCPNCPRRFADCGALRKHLRRHLSLMPYVCEVCGKKCKEPGNLKVHMRIHSDTKQFQCSMCPQAFNYKSSFEGHMRSRHSQNLNTANLSSQVPDMKLENDRVDSLPHQIYRTARIEPNLNQICESSSWKLELPNQAFVSARNLEMKQYYENRTNECMKPVYETNGINADLVTRHVFQDHSMHVRPIDLDVPSKHTYAEGSANVNLSSAYSRGGNPIINGQSHEVTSMSVTSLDVTTMNVSSMNISLY